MSDVLVLDSGADTIKIGMGLLRQIQGIKDSLPIVKSCRKGYFSLFMFKLDEWNNIGGLADIMTSSVKNSKKLTFASITSHV